MTIEADFLELMTQTVQVAPFQGNNPNGEPMYGTAVSYSGRTVNKNKLVRSVEGKEVVSTAQTWTFGSPGITPQDQITLPDGRQPVILSVESYPDEDGDHHQKVYT